MRTERIVWGGGINRSLDPRHIQNYEQYDAYNLEVIQRGTLSKRKGFGRWRTSNNTFSGTVRGIAVMYDRDGNRYLFVAFDGDTGTDLWVEKAGSYISTIDDFFPTEGYRARAAVFGDRIYFVNGVDRPRWYKEYTVAGGHVWGIAGVPTPARRPADESNFDYFISRALYADCITSSEDLGIESPGIWRYKQTHGYYGEEDDTQIEESNAGPASKMFHCQFNMAESLGTMLEGYIRKGVPIGIAAFDDLILDAVETGGQDYAAFTRWMRLYRQWKMFSDELYSPFEHLVELKKTWPTSIRDNYSRDSAVVAPTTRVSLPVAHHIGSVNNRLFLGRVDKELFTQPGLPDDFRGLSGYKPNFSYRMPITITNTGSKTLTSAVMPLRFHDDSDHDDETVATPPSGGGPWYGAYIETSLDVETTDWYQMIFVDEDGVTPLGFCMIAQDSNRTHDITFLVELPEIAAGGSRTIYLYFEDSNCTNAPVAYDVGDWRSVAHYPLCASDHWMLADFENWDSALAIGDVTQKRSLGYIENGAWGKTNGGSRQTITDYFFNKAYSFVTRPSLRVQSLNDSTERSAAIPFCSPGDSSTLFSIAFYASTLLDNTTGSITVDITKADGTLCARIAFQQTAGPNCTITASVWDVDGGNYYVQLSESYASGGVGCYGEFLYYLLTVDGSELTFSAIYGDHSGHAGEESAWDDATHYNIYTVSRNDISKPIRMDSGGMLFGAVTVAGGGDKTANIYFKEMQIVGRKIDEVDELIHMLHRDSYFPDFGLAITSDREAASSEKYPDRFYFSKLNQPNSFEAVNFRDIGDRGEIIHGVKGIHNRVFVLTEREIRALFSAGAEQALTLESTDTTMWNLSQDLTGKIGGLGVLAPDTVIDMEFAGRDGIGFLSKRGFYFFDGQGFVHISEKVDNLIYDEAVSDDYRRNMAAHFFGKKRQLVLGVLGWYTLADYEYWMLVANIKFAHDVSDMVWSRWSNLIRYGVELDFNIDTGQFVYANTPDDVHTSKQVLKLEGNSGSNTYKDISHDETSGIAVTASAQSKQFDLFDSELIEADLHTSGDTGYEVDLTVFKDSLTTGTPTISNITNGLYRFPVGTHATLFMFQLFENSAFRTVFEKLDFYFNMHGRRRL